MKKLTILSFSVILIGILAAIGTWKNKEMIFSKKEEIIEFTGDIVESKSSLESERFREEVLRHESASIKNFAKATQSEKGEDTRKFWVIVAFSGLFSLAGLYVILSKNYDEDTKKWAFSIISLVTGIWLGGAIV